MIFFANRKYINITVLDLILSFPYVYVIQILFMIKSKVFLAKHQKKSKINKCVLM